MKNKHLVFLFLVALCVGLVLRQAPWCKSQYPKRSLLQIDTTTCTRMEVRQAGREDLVFERGDDGRWLLAEGDLSIVLQLSQQQAILQALAGLDIQRLQPTKRPDTLQLDPEHCLAVTLFNQHGPTESFRVGAERRQNGKLLTALMLGKQEGVFWAEGALRSLFSKKLETYRQRAPFEMDWSEVNRIVVMARDSLPVEMLKSDTAQQWVLAQTGVVLPAHQMQQWFQAVDRLKHCFFADYFDETRAKEQLVLEILMEKTGSTPVMLRFFRLDAPEFPEGWPLSSKKQITGPFVLHSSQNPRDYFSVDDSTIVHQLSKMVTINSF